VRGCNVVAMSPMPPVAYLSRAFSGPRSLLLCTSFVVYFGVQEFLHTWAKKPLCRRLGFFSSLSISSEWCQRYSRPHPSKFFPPTDGMTFYRFLFVPFQSILSHARFFRLILLPSASRGRSDILLIESSTPLSWFFLSVSSSFNDRPNSRRSPKRNVSADGFQSYGQPSFSVIHSPSIYGHALVVHTSLLSL